MSPSSISWSSVAMRWVCVGLVLGFVAFGVYSLAIGIDRQTVFTGPVGAWMGIYLLCASAMTFVAFVTLVVEAFRRSETLKYDALLLLASWVTVGLLYWAWNQFAQTQYGPR